MSKASCLLTPPLAKNKTTRVDKKTWHNLQGSSATLALYNGALNSDAPILLVTHDTPSALKIEQEIRSLRQKNTDLPICLFPDWETLPYDTFSPHQDIISQRLATLYQLSRMKKGIVIVPVTTLVQRLAPKKYIETNSLIIEKGDKKDLHQLRQDLEASGYRCVDQVMEHGEFSARGAILDVFPMGSNTPFRLDFFDDEIDEIRLFDPENQRSNEKVDNINLLPAHEFPTDKEAIHLFRSQYREQFKSSIDKESIYHQVSNGILPPGIEYYLPLFFDKTVENESTNTLCDYLAPETMVAISGDLDKALEQYWQDVEYRYENRRYNPVRPLLPPTQLFLTKELLYTALKPFARITIESVNALTNDTEEPTKQKSSAIYFDVKSLPDLTINHKLKSPFELINNYISNTETPNKILFIAESQGRRESVLELLARDNIKPSVFNTIEDFIESNDKLGISVNSLNQGFSFQAKGSAKKNEIALITEAELLVILDSSIILAVMCVPSSPLTFSVTSNSLPLLIFTLQLGNSQPSSLLHDIIVSNNR